MNVPSRATQLRWRWVSFLTGAIILVWLPVEDIDLTIVTFIAIAISYLGTAFAQEKWQVTSQYAPWVFFGGGFFVGPISFILMIAKIGVHTHVAPDFTLHQLIHLLKVSPIWAISAMFFQIGISLYRASRRY